MPTTLDEGVVDTHARSGTASWTDNRQPNEENRQVSSDRLEKSLDLLRRVARPLDLVFRPRLSWLVEGPGGRAAGVVIGTMAILIPPLEFIPFSVSLPAIVIAAFGVSLVTKDGFVLIGSMALAATGFVLLFRAVL